MNEPLAALATRIQASTGHNPGAASLTSTHARGSRLRLRFGNEILQRGRLVI